jgi:hypothetical protein
MAGSRMAGSGAVSVGRALWALMRTYGELMCRPPSLQSPADAGNRYRPVFAVVLPPVFSRRESSSFNSLVLILFASCARRVRTFREGKLRQPAGAAARHPQPQAAGARPCYPAADRAGAVGSDRPQASSVAAARRATPTAASRSDRPGGASGDRSVVVACEAPARA